MLPVNVAVFAVAVICTVGEAGTTARAFGNVIPGQKGAVGMDPHGNNFPAAPLAPTGPTAPFPHTGQQPGRLTRQKRSQPENSKENSTTSKLNSDEITIHPDPEPPTSLGGHPGEQQQGPDGPDKMAPIWGTSAGLTYPAMTGSEHPWSLDQPAHTQYGGVSEGPHNLGIPPYRPQSYNQRYSAYRSYLSTMQPTSYQVPYRAASHTYQYGQEPSLYGQVQGLQQPSQLHLQLAHGPSTAFTVISIPNYGTVYKAPLTGTTVLALDNVRPYQSGADGLAPWLLYSNRYPPAQYALPGVNRYPYTGNEQGYGTSGYGVGIPVETSPYARYSAYGRSTLGDGFGYLSTPLHFGNGEYGVQQQEVNPAQLDCFDLIDGMPFGQQCRPFYYMCFDSQLQSVECPYYQFFDNIRQACVPSSQCTQVHYPPAPYGTLPGVNPYPHTGNEQGNGDLPGNNNTVETPP